MYALKVLLSLAGVVGIVVVSVFVLPNVDFIKATETLEEVVLIDDDRVLGTSNAPVLFVVFGDFLCEFCGELAEDIMPFLRREFIDTGKVRFVFRDFVPPVHGLAIPAAAAVSCAEDFWSVHDVLYMNAYKGDKWSELSEKHALEKFAEYTGNECANDPVRLKEVSEDIAKGLLLGVKGTPTIFIGNDEKGFVRVLSVQKYEVYKNIIEEMLG